VLEQEADKNVVKAALRERQVKDVGQLKRDVAMAGAMHLGLSLRQGIRR